jgi:D-glycero-D-manno-heptose 1,7-bisphosphate phosphatase
VTLYKEVITETGSGNGRAVFLDRDGTINAEGRFVTDPAHLVYIPGALESLARLARTDYRIIVVTNQGGIGSGYYTLDQYKAVMARFIQDVRAAGGRIDAHYCCPHHHAAGCGCRKPGTGLIDAAIHDFSLDPGQCAMVGDRTSDIAAGHGAKCRHSILVLTGDAGRDGRAPAVPTYTAKDLSAAIDHILSHG